MNDAFIQKFLEEVIIGTKSQGTKIQSVVVEICCGLKIGIFSTEIG